MADSRRGEIWLVDLNPTRGREPFARRPALIISVDLFNQGPAELIVVLPVTSTEKGIPFHVPIQVSEGGLDKKSFIKCEDIRSISKDRLSKRLGLVTQSTMAAVEDRLRILLNL
ncbi:MAG: type II toxin-antitoxin system PemK/MazF family toxin [Deltaproteobacteria bacterium]|nr:type II toxin-antitoxin system PemK/MazF family toxin [Deltaproteobacteria bacterium]